MGTFADCGLRIFERGWLSANNVFFDRSDQAGACLVDSGYVTHSAQTLSLVQQALPEGERLSLLLNTHLHSDHCGGNAVLQRAYPGLTTGIPPGEADAVAAWDSRRLTFDATGQLCERFSFQRLLHPGDVLQLGSRSWQIHPAAGHDPHSIILFEPIDRILISADALWENGFGVVFPEIEGEQAFSEVSATLDLIESLQPEIVIPGHGPVFVDASSALIKARHRLDAFCKFPERHTRYAAKVLVKFKLLEWQQVPREKFDQWAFSTPYFTHHLMPSHSREVNREWLSALLEEMQRGGAIDLYSDQIVNRN